MPVALQHIYSLFVIMIGWVFFRADTLGAAVDFIKGMFVPYGKDIAYLNVTLNPQYVFFLVMGILFSIPHTKAMERVNASPIGRALYEVFVLLTFVLAIIYMVGSGYSPFLYFRF